MKKKWDELDIAGIADELETLNTDYYFKEKTIGFAGKEKVRNVIRYLRSALFPGVYEKHPIDEKDVNKSIADNMGKASVELLDLVEKAFKNECSDPKLQKKGCDKCRRRAEEVVAGLIYKLPYIRKMLHMDIQAAYDGDPAACSNEEILLSYPSIEVMGIHRIAHELYRGKVPMIPRIMSEYAHKNTGIDIHPGARIGRNFFIDHGTGIVIGETCIIGDNVKIYQGVTLGAKSFPLDQYGRPIKGIKRHPNSGDHVLIYSGATILGGDTAIGHDSVIGGNVWLTHSVPPYSNVYNSQPKPTVKSKNGE
jgi:serine O-acetyltransferase